MCEVLATSGDTHLGGDDFDKRIVDLSTMKETQTQRPFHLENRLFIVLFKRQLEIM